jgi:hypothetical protein
MMKTKGEPSTKKHPIFGMSFARVYPLYVQKVEKKGRKKKELDEVICWLTGYSPQALKEQIERKNDVETFFNQAPGLNPNAGKITGTICGVRIEEIEDPLMRKLRYMDKLVDELAKGRPMEKVLRK